MFLFLSSVSPFLVALWLERGTGKTLSLLRKWVSFKKEGGKFFCFIAFISISSEQNTSLLFTIPSLFSFRISPSFARILGRNCIKEKLHRETCKVIKRTIICCRKASPVRHAGLVRCTTFRLSLKRVAHALPPAAWINLDENKHFPKQQQHTIARAQHVKSCKLAVAFSRWPLLIRVLFPCRRFSFLQVRPILPTFLIPRISLFLFSWQNFDLLTGERDAFEDGGSGLLQEGSGK